VSGFYTLFYKEWLRFWKVSVQTVLAPMLSALLFLLMFGHTLRNTLEPYPGVGYSAFLVPGLAMMSVLQNAFANASSSLMQSKMTGNIIFVLLPPLSHREFFFAYLLAAVARGLICGAGVLLFTVWFVDLRFDHPLWIFIFGLLGAVSWGCLHHRGLQSTKSTSCRVSELHHPLTFRRGILFAPLAAAVVAGLVSPELFTWSTDFATASSASGCVTMALLDGSRRILLALSF
jgi:ABC-2 type transport system permease protein